MAKSPDRRLLKPSAVNGLASQILIDTWTGTLLCSLQVAYQQGGCGVMSLAFVWQRLRR